jgi:hypothetical protein
VLAGAPVVEAEVGLADRPGRRAVGGLAGDGHRAGRAGVEDQVEPLPGYLFARPDTASRRVGKLLGHDRRWR